MGNVRTYEGVYERLSMQIFFIMSDDLITGGILPSDDTLSTDDGFDPDAIESDDLLDDFVVEDILKDDALEEDEDATLLAE